MSKVQKSVLEQAAKGRKELAMMKTIRLDSTNLFMIGLGLFLVIIISAAYSDMQEQATTLTSYVVIGAFFTIAVVIILGIRQTTREAQP